MLKINDWDEWQTFRKDRGSPPWIKLHRKLMTCPKWAVLSDAEKGQLISIWIVAADKNGEIPDDPTVLMKICMLDKKPNINKFIDLGLMTPTCQPHDNHKKISCQPLDAPEESREEQSREEESREEKRRADTMSGKPDDMAIGILNYLNDKACKKFQPVDSNLKLINQRLKEGHQKEDCLWVIDAKVAEWINNEKLNKYLRPATLFNAEKFNNYIGEKGAIKPLSDKEKFHALLDEDNNFIEGEYDAIE